MMRALLLASSAHTLSIQIGGVFCVITGGIFHTEEHHFGVNVLGHIRTTNID